MPRPELREATTALLDSPLVIVGPSHITSAMQNEDRHQISFWTPSSQLLRNREAARSCTQRS
jgi:hypothetical protein